MISPANAGPTPTTARATSDMKAATHVSACIVPSSFVCRIGSSRGGASQSRVGAHRPTRIRSRAGDARRPYPYNADRRGVLTHATLRGRFRRVLPFRPNRGPIRAHRLRRSMSTPGWKPRAAIFMPRRRLWMGSARDPRPLLLHHETLDEPAARRRAHDIPAPARGVYLPLLARGHDAVAEGAPPRSRRCHGARCSRPRVRLTGGGQSRPSWCCW